LEKDVTDERIHERGIATIEDAIATARAGMRVILILNSRTQCAKIAEGVRLRDKDVMTASQGQKWMLTWSGGGMIVCYPDFMGVQQVDETLPGLEDRRLAHWAELAGAEWHKGNSRAWTSPIRPMIRAKLV